MSPGAIFPVTAYTLKANVILAGTPPIPFLSFLWLGAFTAFHITLPGFTIRLSDTIPLCCLERQLKIYNLQTGMI